MDGDRAGRPGELDRPREIDLAAAGVRRISLGSALSRIAFGAFLDAVREVKAQGSFSFTARSASFQELEAFMLDRS